MEEFGNCREDIFAAVLGKFKEGKGRPGIAKSVKKAGSNRRKTSAATLGKSEEGKDVPGVAKSVEEFGGGEEICTATLVKKNKRKGRSEVTWALGILGCKEEI